MADAGQVPYWVAILTAAGGAGLGGIAVIVSARITTRSQRALEREKRLDALFDKGLELARTRDDAVARAEGRTILLQLSKEAKFAPVQAQLAGKLVEMLAAKELELAREADQQGRPRRFWQRLADDPGQSGP